MFIVHWIKKKNNTYCRTFDQTAEKYGITQRILDNLKNNNGPSVTTPTNLIYGCNSVFFYLIMFVLIIHIQ